MLHKLIEDLGLSDRLKLKYNWTSVTITVDGVHSKTFSIIEVFTEGVRWIKSKVD